MLRYKSCIKQASRVAQAFNIIRKVATVTTSISVRRIKPRYLPPIPFVLALITSWIAATASGNAAAISRLPALISVTRPWLIASCAFCIPARIEASLYSFSNASWRSIGVMYFL